MTALYGDFGDGPLTQTLRRDDLPRAGAATREHWSHRRRPRAHRAGALAAGRDPATVKLVAVSKTKPVSAIREAYAAGQRDFGENYAQELAEKATELEALADIRWHFIGHLQSNKAKLVAPVAHLVHAVDSASLASRAREARADGPRSACSSK